MLDKCCNPLYAVYMLENCCNPLYAIYFMVMAVKNTVFIMAVKNRMVIKHACIKLLFFRPGLYTTEIENKNLHV